MIHVVALREDFCKLARFVNSIAHLFNRKSNIENPPSVSVEITPRFDKTSMSHQKSSSAASFQTCILLCSEILIPVAPHKCIGSLGVSPEPADSNRRARVLVQDTKNLHGIAWTGYVTGDAKEKLRVTYDSPVGTQLRRKILSLNIGML